MLLLAGDERIELPPKVLETPIIPFDQSPKFLTVEIIHIKHTIVNRKSGFFIYNTGNVSDNPFQECGIYVILKITYFLKDFFRQINGTREKGDNKIMEFQAKWICGAADMGDVCPVFRKGWSTEKKVLQAKLYITALGVYEAELNGTRVGEYVLAPGWTVYEKRVQYQEYDITSMLREENQLQVTVGKGWFASQMPGWVESEDRKRRAGRSTGILAEIHVTYEDGTEQVISTDQSWQYGESPVRFSEIYDGEIYDAGFRTEIWKQAELLDWTKDTLIPQEGEEIREKGTVDACRIIYTPAGETVVDFGQEITGYVEFTVDAKGGEEIRILHGEVLDQQGNFYNANYRSAKAEIRYICKPGLQTWHPGLTFFGFRYIKLDKFPGEVEAGQFRAVSVYSDIKKTGSLKCGVSKINQLFSNIFWGQKDNFLDVPTDCPQRDERLGWTGDAQVFVKTASYNYNVEKFFTKWLHDMAADQRPDGGIGQVIPDYLPEGNPSSAWGDAAVICPWQIYLTYGHDQILKDQFESMKGWVDYITGATETQYLWTGGEHFGDWLGLDAPSGSYKGSSREDFIATAFYAYSTELLVKAGKALKKDMAEYEALYENIVKTFRKTYPEYKTQTEYVLAVQFHLAEDPKSAADALAEMVVRDGKQIRTGFVGTPYILHVLSEYGHSDLAYTLFLREEYPSWLYSVNKGATTIWEHWDGIMENGEFWSTDMNSFNHYAYGSVADWVYEKAAGICLQEEKPGFSGVKIEPHTDKRLGWLEASIETAYGKIQSSWTYVGDQVRYDIKVPIPASVIISGTETEVEAGEYTFWS